VETGRRLVAEHGVIASFPDDFFGYFGWPTVARMEDSTLVVVASGLRNSHICPFGKTIICTSDDDGATWTPPAVVNDFPIDDRDAGIVSPGGDTLLVSWFSSDTRLFNLTDDVDDWEDRRKAELYVAGLKRITDTTSQSRSGYWIRASRNRGESWEPPVRVHLTAPHGPILLSDGRFLFFGKGDLGQLGDTTQLLAGIGAMVSSDGCTGWRTLGTVPLADGTDATNYYEPHVVQLEEDHLLGLIRIQDGEEEGRMENLGLVSFGMAQTRSRDGGMTWSQAQPLNFHGSPPHVFRHSSGTVVCAYGYRLKPFGERVMLSDDDGETWSHNWILRDDGPDRDLGYPSSVELVDGSILTVYYQKIVSSEEKCSLLWSRWRLPKSHGMKQA
jgi:sialidase-1